MQLLRRNSGKEKMDEWEVIIVSPCFSAIIFVSELLGIVIRRFRDVDERCGTCAVVSAQRYQSHCLRHVRLMKCTE